jgi:glycosyltransferase involved in cell wall biosynthesis
MPAASEGQAEDAGRPYRSLLARGTGGRPLRIALFSGNYNYIKDGVALTLDRLVRYLERAGIPVLIFSPVGEAPAFDSAGEVVPVPSVAIPSRSEYRLSLGLPRRVRERLAAFQPTLFHLTAPDLLGYRALQLAQAWNLPVVASYHTRFDTYLRFYGLSLLEWPLRRYLRHFYGQCHQVYPPSESMADLLRHEGIAGNVRIWSRGVDADRFTPARRSQEWRRSQGVGDDEVVVAFVGRLVKEKNTALLARIFAAMAARGMPFRPMIVGDGPEGPALKAALPDAIFTGFLHDEALARAYASADVFLFPSESETFGNVTLEAMASGLPAVCAAASGSRSLVVEGATGYLAASGSVAAFVDRLGPLVADPALRARLGSAARERALEFGWDGILGQLHASYLAVLAACSTPVEAGMSEPAARPIYRPGRLILTGDALRP